ncbi:hypothetical protein JK636_18855 [Clostridium sp. YIM B02515]|uniref:Uncharacterized protein n=1 Tax=Clostridium rhizosphaerae TaxID=2803861 RepID=A0ABS1TEG7_9CLOT|nr:hypothetical protein [Clostridium rhizosphaerae]MBL4937769.1 hypothetical protein [Clostridium rhizosphaerae]
MKGNFVNNMENKLIKKMVVYIIRLAVIFTFIVIILLAILNPNRGSFNSMVFENIRTVTNNSEIINQIREVNLKDYRDDYHPLVKRRNYFVFSIYDVHINNTKTYHIIGFLECFKLLS